MDFTPKRKRFAWKETETIQSKYNHDLQMYKEPPEDNISFEEFQQIAVERLKVLQLVENIGAQCLASPEECLQALQKALKKEGYLQFAKLITKKGCSSQTEEDIEARRRDNYSHFTLRLAFGMKEESRPWFIIHETELFKWRFSALNKEGVIKLLSIYDFDFKPISIEEKTEFMDKLNNSSYKDVDVCNMDYYKLPYTDVLDLIYDRKVFVQKGMAYVPQTDLISVFVTSFKKQLSADLQNVPRYISNIRHDDRLINFLKSLPECFSGMARVVWNSETTPITMLPELSKSSYPLCMRIMHEQLLANSHLRNGGRLAYGLFLKGIGVTLEDSLIFWKDIFSNGKERDTFDKQHKYTFRHLYGQEGKKCNYTPFSCTKIINSAVGVGEYHGCPYRYMDSQALKNRLNEYSLPLPQVNEIVDLAKKGEYLNACKTYFEVTNGGPPETFTIHPNAYFMESRAIHNGTKCPDSSYSQTQTQSTVKSEKSVFSPAVTPKSERRTDFKSPTTRSAQVRTPIVKKKLDIEKMLNEDDDLDDFNDFEILN